MRRNIAIGTLGLMVLLAAAIVTSAQDGPPQGPGPGQGQHQWGGGGQHQWGGGQRKFEGGGHGEFGGPGMHGHGGFERGGRHGFGGGDHLVQMAENPRVRQYLGLTDDQVARLHKIGLEAEKSSIQTRADLELRHVELHELLRADNPDHDAIMQKLDEVNALQGKMEKQHVETMLSARGVLTPDQIKKVKEFMEHRGPEGGPGHEHGMEHHGGMGRPGGHGGPGGEPGGPAMKPQAPPAQ
jgi:Spy/CpxP family protein refolding chaperone